MNELDDRVEEYAAKIAANWQKMVSTILDTAAICDRANRNFSKAKKQLLLERLPFSPSVFSMLAQVGHHPRFKDEGVVTLLPPSYSTLYLLTHFGDAEWDKAVNEGVLHKNATRSELNVWLRGARKKKGRAGLPKGFYAGIRFAAQPTRSQLERLEELLDSIGNELGAEIVKRPIKVAPAWKLYDRKIFASVKRQLGNEVTAKWKREPSTKKAVGEEMNVSFAKGLEDLQRIATLVEESDQGGAVLFQKFLATAHQVVPAPDVPLYNDPYAPASLLPDEQAAELEEAAKEWRSKPKGKMGKIDKAKFDIFRAK